MTGFLFDKNNKNSVLSSKKENAINKKFDAYQITIQKKDAFQGILENCDSFTTATSHDQRYELKNDSLSESIETIQKKADTSLKIIVEAEKKQYEEYRTSILLAAQELEIERQVAVENKYFNPEKCKDPYVTKIGTEILKRYDPLNTKNSESIEIDMTNKPAALLIAAERTLMELSIKSQKKDRRSESSEIAASISPGNKNPQNKSDKLAREWIRYGTFHVKYKTSNTVRSPNHQGDYEIENLGRYQKIATQIQTIIGEDRNKSIQLTQLMLDLMSRGIPIKSEQLTSLGIEVEKVEKTAEFITKLCVNLIKETCRRQTPKERRHIFPYAAIQAKALLLARDGIIHLTEIFDQQTSIYQKYDCQMSKPYGALFGIPTTNSEPIAAGDNVMLVREKGKFINEFSNKNILEKADLSSEESFSGKDYCFISSQKRILDDLQTVYGGADNMDNEGYSSEEEYSQLQVKKRAC